ncbi:MAG: single-stranded DNA-binding protein [Eubacteriales bacterium]|nr:single-stranded DNA-binding protein [Eubacteriales bacterium]
MDFGQNNVIELAGVFVQKPQYCYMAGDLRMYMGYVAVVRLSGTIDELPVILPESMLGSCDGTVRLRGQICSRNVFEEGKSRLKLTVRVREIEEGFQHEGLNEVNLTGYLCKPPIYRKTPLNREITDLLLAVNRNGAKSDYIPCVTWGKTAWMCRELPVGSVLQMKGRFQSRKYQKETPDGIVQRTAYELSVSRATIQKIPT